MWMGEGGGGRMWVTKRRRDRRRGKDRDET